MTESPTQEVSSIWGALFALGILGYVVTGVLWADAHPEDRNKLIGMDVFDYLSQVALWPAHLVGLLPL